MDGGSPGCVLRAPGCRCSRGYPPAQAAARSVNPWPAEALRLVVRARRAVARSVARLVVVIPTHLDELLPRVAPRVAGGGAAGSGRRLLSPDPPAAPVRRL